MPDFELPLRRSRQQMLQLQTIAGQLVDEMKDGWQRLRSEADIQMDFVSADGLAHFFETSIDNLTALVVRFEREAILLVQRMEATGRATPTETLVGLLSVDRSDTMRKSRLDRLETHDEVVKIRVKTRHLLRLLETHSRHLEAYGADIVALLSAAQKERRQITLGLKNFSLQLAEKDTAILAKEDEIAKEENLQQRAVSNKQLSLLNDQYAQLIEQRIEANDQCEKIDGFIRQLEFWLTSFEQRSGVFERLQDKIHTIRSTLAQSHESAEIDSARVTKTLRTT